MKPLKNPSKCYCEAIQWYNWSQLDNMSGQKSLKQRFAGQVVCQKAAKKTQIVPSSLLSSHRLHWWPWINREHNHIPVSRSHLCPKVNFQANEDNVEKNCKSHALYYATYEPCFVSTAVTSTSLSSLYHNEADIDWSSTSFPGHIFFPAPQSCSGKKL